MSAPTVAAQQCGRLGGLAAFREALELPRWYSDAELLSAIRAYLTSATPPDVAGLIERLEKAKWAITNGKKPDWDAAERAIEEAATRLEALEAALEPFAAFADFDPAGTAYEGKGDDTAILFDHKTGRQVTIGDLRAARRAREGGNADG